FALLGAEPALGRTFMADDALEGRGAVAVLSDGLWHRRFGAERNVIGRSVTLNGTDLTIIGVMPRGFQWFIEESSRSNKPPELWVPMRLSETLRDRTKLGRYMQSVGRLKPGVSIEQAQAEMNAIAGRLETQYPDYNTNWGILLVPLRDQLAGAIKPALLVLLGGGGVVALIAGVNVANLLLARAAGRHKEIAIRSAIGAGRRRII